MGSYYVTDAADVLRAAGLTVVETGICAGWQKRARSSGGFDAPPYGVIWHHTASSTTPDADLLWMINGSDDAPIGNLLLARDGTVYLIAGGAANTAGKGGPIKFSRGTVPKDKGNTTTWNFEVANDGQGEPWPQVQIDAYFAASNAMNTLFGNQPTDLTTHNGYCEPSCPGRKIDPATAAAVQGPWQPSSINASGTWSVDDIRAEAEHRAGPTPDPGDDDMTNDQFDELMAALNTTNARLQSIVDDLNKIEPRTASIYTNCGLIAERMNYVANDGLRRVVDDVDRLTDKLVGPD